jgi:hypothetical protein
LQLGHANFCGLVILAQAFSNAEAHFAQDRLESETPRIALEGRHDALDESVSLVLRVVECRRNKESENFLHFIGIEPFWVLFKCTNVTTQATENEILRPAEECRGGRHRPTRHKQSKSFVEGQILIEKL